ncbi:MAG: nitrile hydratase subunit beta [Alphaproteobacteria bacterium]|nr:nitrile hydratase subunit beta [Alphaproteobacteria bacterium]
MSAPLALGTAVRVRAAYPPGHIRTPFYVRGKRGRIVQYCGDFGNPETLAYGHDGTPRQPLYRVHFAQSEVWPDYRGVGRDSLEVEIYSHWLEPAGDAP